MADLMRMLESYSRQTKQQEDKVIHIKQQEDTLLKELASVQSSHADKQRHLAETQGRCGEVLSELQQKRTTLIESQAANGSIKAAISQVQEQRQQLWQQLQEVREKFITACATLDSEADIVLSQLRTSLVHGKVQAEAAVSLQC